MSKHLEIDDLSNIPQLLHTARTYFQANEFTKAIKLLQALVENDPSPPSAAFIILGNSFLHRNELHQALNAFRQLIEKHPNEEDQFVKGVFYCGNKYFQLENYDAAISLYLEIRHLGEFPRWTDKKIAQSYVQLGELSKAEKVFLEIQKKYKDSELIVAEGFVQIADRHSNANNFSASHRLLTAAVILDPDNYNLKTLLARRKLQLGQFDEAEKLILTLLQRSPNDFQLIQLLAELYRLSRADVKYVKTLLKLIAHKDFNGINLHHTAKMAVFYDYEKPIMTAIQKFAERKKRPVVPVIFQAKIFEHKGEWAKAKEQLEKILSLRPKDASTALNIGKMLFKQLKYDQTKAYYQNLIDKDSRSEAGYKGMIFYHQSLFLKKEAIEWGEKAIKLFPKDLQLLQIHFQNQLQFYKMDDARSSLAILMDEIENPLQKINLKIQLLEEEDQFEAAIELLDQALKDYPKDKYYLLLKKARLYGRSEMLKGPKNIQNAKHICEDLMRTAPAYFELKLFLTGIYINLKENEKAIALIKTIPGRLIFHAYVRLLRSWEAVQKGDVPWAKKTWGKIKNDSWFLPISSPINNMQLISKDLKINDEDVVLFSVVRDESYRIVSFLDYYRKMGVDKFIFVDNMSTDGTDKVLLEHEDVILYSTTDTYAQSFNGVRWIHHLMDHYITKQWCMYVDVDEFLVFPHSEKVGLRPLLKYMDHNGHEGIKGFMLDCYTKDNFLVSITEQNPLDQALWFYNEYQFCGWENPPHNRVFGGFRAALYDELNIILSKTPIIKGGKGIRFITSSHATSPFVSSDVTSCFVHLKYSQYFFDRAEEEMKRKMHYKGGKRYFLYAKEKDKVLNFDTNHEKSVRYESSAQLVDLGLIHSSDAYETWLRKYAHIK